MKRRTMVLLLIVAAVVAAVSAVAFRPPGKGVHTGTGVPPAQLPASSVPAVNPAPKVAATDAPTLVRLYFSSLQAGNLPAAYAYLSPDLQRTLTYQAFVSGFKGSRLTGYDSSSLRVAGAGNFSLTVEVPYTLSGSSSGGSYVATLRCVDLNGGYGQPDWRVESLSMPAGKQKP